MKIKQLLPCFLFLSILVSCDEFNKQQKSNNIDMDNIGMMVSEEGDTSDEETTTESLMPTSKSFYTNLLDLFCQNHFDTKFEGDHYINGTIVVVKIEQKSDSVVEVSGTHSYKGQSGAELTGQMFKSVILGHGNNTYNVKFSKGSTKVLSDKSYWDSAEAEFTYQ